jgi:hypothetical protein
VQHISDKDYSAVVAMALAMDGFTDEVDNGQVLVGFGRNAVLGVADKVIEAVKSKAIRHFFLVGGCDGAKPGRDYYTKFVEQVPKDCVVLTLACGKFRFFDKDLGDIGGIPRLLDVGQCNDAYSAIQIAVALSKAFGCGVNDLPLSMVLVLVRAEGGGHPPDPAVPRHQGYPPRTVAAGLHLADRAPVPGRHLRHQAGGRHPRGRSGRHPWTELLAGRDDLLKDKVALAMRRYFGEDSGRIKHADEVARYAEEIGKLEKGNMAVIMAAAYLHAIGLREAERKFGPSAAGHRHTEGPPVARELLTGLRAESGLVEEVCDIIGHHHAPGASETINFKVLHDADLIVKLEEQYREVPPAAEVLETILNGSFLTDSGRRAARKALMKPAGK